MGLIKSHWAQELRARRLLEDALSYARRGISVVPLCWPVFPKFQLPARCGCGGCRDGADVGKRLLLPELPQGPPNEVQIRRWWMRWPLANVGIVLDASSLVVVDFDGPEALEESQFMDLTLTRVAATGKGLHYYYRRPPECPELRAERQGCSREIGLYSEGYVVAPPSLHPWGNYYHWRGKRSAAEATGWIVELMLDAQGHQAQKEVLELGELRLDCGNQEALLAEDELPLSGSEFSLLALLVRHAGEVVELEAMARALVQSEHTGFCMDVQKMIREHVWQLRKKLSRAMGSASIKNVWGSGYKLTHAQAA